MRQTDMVTWLTAIDTESVSDSGSSVTVLVVSLTLVALGIALLGVTVWFWRLTRPDPDALGPLVVMSDRDFPRRGPIEQRRALDSARPDVVLIDAPRDSTIVDGPESETEIGWPSDTATAVDDPVDFEFEPEAPAIEPETMEETDEDPAPASRSGSIDPLL